MDAIGFTARGNAVGFTAKGETICGQTIRKTRSFRVWVDSPMMLLDSRTRTFGSSAEAKRYAASLIDEDKTRDLAWW